MENRSTLYSAIADAAGRRRDEIIRTRRDFHRNPEQGWMEVRTASLLAARLEALGWDVQVGPDVIDPAARMGLPPEEELETAFRRALDGGAEETMAARMKGGFTGVVGVLEGKGGRGGGPTVALRFDIDANAISGLGRCTTAAMTATPPSASASPLCSGRSATLGRAG